MREIRVTVVNPLGLHARAAAQLVRLAGSFQSRIVLRRVGSELSADARSILSLLTLSASIGSHLDIKVEGEDAEAALAAVSELFEMGFGEI
jgi:phosphotransferase system HPr (HPr) family protein